MCFQLLEQRQALSKKQKKRKKEKDGKHIELPYPNTKPTFTVIP